MTRVGKILIAAFVVLVGASTAGVGETAPNATLADANAKLDYGATAGKATMVLQVDGLDAQGLKDSALVGVPRDLGTPETTKVELTAVERQPAGATARVWLIMAQAQGLPANTAQGRHLSVDVAGKTVTLAYTLTNKAVANFTWAVKAPASVAIAPGDAIPVGISVGPVPASGVKLVNPFLTEKSSKTLIAPAGLVLCRDAKTACAAAPIDLPANTVNQLWLHGSSGIGTFEGTITLAAAEKPEGDPITLAVSSTTIDLKVWGIVTIFAGVVLAWFIMVFLRNLVNRTQMLMPAAALRQRLDDLPPTLQKNPTGTPATAISDKITEVQTQLTPERLALAGLPGAFPVSVGTQPAAEQIERYRKTIQTAADWVAALETLVHEGLEPAWAKWNAAFPADKKAHFALTIKHLDDAVRVTTPPTLDKVRERIEAELNALDKALTGVAPPAAMGAGPSAPPKTVEQLIVQVALVSAFMWLFVVVGTTAVGTLALVLTSSFGSLSDFVTCLLWGLGLPIGTQAMAATMSGVGTSLGITIVK